MTTTKTIEIHRGHERGRTELGWLHGWHSFSFGRYYDPSRRGYRALRVINEDIVEPGGGFGRHPHDNMEIITWMLSGALEHADSAGNRGVIRPGDAQVMSAGSGIEHSEMNASQTERAHLLQIWIVPAARETEPSYGQRTFDAAVRHNQWQAIASPDGRDSSMPIGQDATLSVADLDSGVSLAARLDGDRFGYLHVAHGTVQAVGETLNAGDAVTLAGPFDIKLTADSDSQVLLFDLA